MPLQTSNVSSTDRNAAVSFAMGRKKKMKLNPTIFIYLWKLSCKHKYYYKTYLTVEQD